jgi:putative protease
LLRFRLQGLGRRKTLGVLLQWQFCFCVRFIWTSFLFQTQPYIVKRKSTLQSQEGIVEVGQIKHFFSKISVAVLELTAPLSVGDRILVKGPSTDFEQVVESMQIEHQSIQRAEGGQSIGLKLAQPCRERDVVYKKL